MMQTRWLRFGAALAACVPMAAWAQAADPHRWQLNMGKGVTPMAHNAYNTHMWGLWMCVVIGVIVFGAMFYALFAFRKSKGAVAAKFSHNTRAEIIWTVIPIIILVVLTIPTIRNLVYVYDTGKSDMTVRVTGFQWPAFGLKQDAIPGIVNEAWVNIEQPGIYRGQCAELCGKDHGFMPIVVKAVTMEEYKAWIAEQKAAKAAAAG
ncbi:MAG: cytochrome c oxidase subunit II [Xanthomonadales bacterium]|nr:cytochrome c oxidase subunit II [Xanthomonadales bacterium]